jgi:Thrombospondin type 3 repeat
MSHARFWMLAFAIGLGGVGALGCVDGEELGPEVESLVSDQFHNGGTKGFFFLPPMVSDVPKHFTGVFEDDLAPTVRVDRIDPKTVRTLSTVATMTAADREVRHHPRREFYIARFQTGKYHLDPANTYRVRVLIDGKEVGFADLDVVGSMRELQGVDTSRYVPVMNGALLPIIFRIERQATDQDGDGVPDWRDNCPTIYNPPSTPKHDALPSTPTPPKCDYRHDDCDPQEVDCHKPETKKQADSDHDGIGDACECGSGTVTCAPTDACHLAGSCDPTRGSCTVVPAPDGTSCSDGNACNGVETCQAGNCVAGPPPACAASTDPCQVSLCDMVNGCTTTPAADGVACAVAHGSGACSAGRCTVKTCNAGFDNCDSNAANGCEHDVSDDAFNCGACGHVCNPTCERLVFAEDWESGTDGWRAIGDPVSVVTDGMAPCDSQFQRETITFGGGRVFSTPGTPVDHDQPHCLTAWIRATPDAMPFLGMQLADADGNLEFAEHWLIGMAGYGTGYPADVVTPVVSDGSWRWYAKGFTMDAAASHIVVKDENFGSGAADFDQIRLFQGPCPVAPAAQCAPAQPVCAGAMTCTAGSCL